MRKVKDNKNIQDKINLVHPIEKICFSFEYLSDNKNYSMKRFKAGTEKSNVFDTLLDKLSELSKVSIKELQGQPKKSGFEKIPWSQLNLPLQQICDNINIITKDSKLTVFRFGNQKYRLLCKDDVNHSNLLYIIALDLDFSAYNHG